MTHPEQPVSRPAELVRREAQRWRDGATAYRIAAIEQFDRLGEGAQDGDPRFWIACTLDGATLTMQREDLEEGTLETVVCQLDDAWPVHVELQEATSRRFLHATATEVRRGLIRPDHSVHQQLSYQLEPDGSITRLFRGERTTARPDGTTLVERDGRIERLRPSLT